MSHPGRLLKRDHRDRTHSYGMPLMADIMTGRLLTPNDAALSQLFDGSSHRYLAQHPEFVRAGAGADAVVWAGAGRGGRLEMAIPFVVRDDPNGLRHLQSPYFSSFAGPLVAGSVGRLDGPAAERFWRDALRAVSDALAGEGDSREVICPSGVTDLRALAWAGWELRPHYTYVTCWEADGAWYARAEGSVRREARKAQDAGLVPQTRAASDSGALRQLWLANSEKQGLGKSYANNIGFLADWLESSGCGFIVSIDESTGVCHAAGLFGFDTHRVYYLAGASDPTLRGSGAPSLLHFAVLNEIERRGLPRCYDWVGANVQLIARFKRNFNPELELRLAARWTSPGLKLTEA